MQWHSDSCGLNLQILEITVSRNQPIISPRKTFESLVSFITCSLSLYTFSACSFSTASIYDMIHFSYTFSLYLYLRSSKRLLSVHSQIIGELLIVFLWKIGASILIPCCKVMKSMESDLPSGSGRDWAKGTSLKLEKYISVQVSGPYTTENFTVAANLTSLHDRLKKQKLFRFPSALASKVWSVFDRCIWDCDISLIILVKWENETAVLLSLVIELCFSSHLL